MPFPEYSDFIKNPYSINLLDKNGLILRTLTIGDGVRREYIPYKKIPKLVKQVFIRSEDKRFYFHCGFDLIAIFRTVYLNTKYNKVISGASTIPMQLARIISPHNGGLKGKILEIINAIRIEGKLSKNKIIETWLNSIPFGHKAIGIQSASKTFFAKNIDELSPSEILALAVIPRSPSKYNPILEKENVVQAVLELSKKIEYKINKEDIKSDIKNAHCYKWEYEAPHFVNSIKSKINYKKKRKLWSIKTSLDLDFNTYLENILNGYLDNLKDLRISNGAILVINNNTGEIISYIGSMDFHNKEYSGEIDGIQIKRQPGSTLKPFLYAFALENGFLPSMILPDIQLDFGNENIYIPLNYNKRFNGPVRLRVALASSLNIPAIYLVTRLGVGNFINLLLDLEFDSISTQINNLGCSIAVGGVDVSLFELVRAFSIFPKGGIINKITWKKVESDYNYIKAREDDRVFSEYTSFLICDILSDNKSRVLGFGRNSILNTPFTAMFKTGTSNQFNNIWALGATKDYTVGVWMGNFGGETVIGRTGSSVPAEIAVKALYELTKGNSKEFTKPANIKKVLICPLSGERVTNNCDDTIYEYFLNNISVPNCSYHLKENNKKIIKYPKEYFNWIGKYGNNYKNYKVNYEGDCKYPEIIKPKNNSIYYFDSSILHKDQAICFEVLHNDENEDLNVFVNNKYYRTLKFPFEMYFPIKPGIWNIRIEGKDNYDDVDINVN